MKRIIPNIASHLKKIYPGEIFIAVIAIGLINNIYYPEDPGFFDTHFNPYFIIIIFFSYFYGKLSGIITLFISIICIVINSIIIDNNSHIIGSLISFSSESRYNSMMQFLFLSFIFSIIFGEIRDSLGTRIEQYKDAIQDLFNKNNKLEHEVKAISLVNEEYQDRILGQQNSLISLYSTMIALNSLDLEKIYPNISF